MDQKESKHETELIAIRDLVESTGWRVLCEKVAEQTERLTNDLINNEYPPNKNADAVRAEIRALYFIIREPSRYLSEIEHLKKTDEGTS